MVHTAIKPNEVVRCSRIGRLTLTLPNIWRGKKENNILKPSRPIFVLFSTRYERQFFIEYKLFIRKKKKKLISSIGTYIIVYVFGWTAVIYFHIARWFLRSNIYCSTIGFKKQRTYACTAFGTNGLSNRSKTVSNT